MEAVVYHRVWNDREFRRWPHIESLHFDDFRRQLDWLSRLDRQVQLTFDDGLRCHLDIVLPEIESRNIWGFFFVPARSACDDRFCGIHALHHMIGTGQITRDVAREVMAHSRGGADVFDWLECVPELWLDSVGVLELAASPYAVIGCHGYDHARLSVCDETQTIRETVGARTALVDAGLAAHVYAYPYGGPWARNRWVEKYLSAFGQVYDVAQTGRGSGHVRTDCNLLPYGMSRIGGRRVCCGNSPR